MDKQLSPLAEAFHFTPDDLRANQHGRLSFRQKRRLWARWLGTALGGVLLTLVPMLVAWGLVAWSGEVSFGEALNDNRAGIGVLVGGLLGLLYLLINLKRFMLVFDLLIGRVRPVKSTAQRWGSYLIMGKHRFLVEADVSEWIQSGLTYRAFILPASGTFLSIEFAE